MTEKQLAKRVIKELQEQFLKVSAENEFLKGNITASEYEETTNSNSKPDKFKDKELSQMMYTLMKLTNNYEMEPSDIAIMLNTDLADVYRVYERIDVLLDKIN